jgi:hypothetical protein
MRAVNKLMTNKIFKVFMAVVLAIGLSIPTTLFYTAKASAADGTQNTIYEEATRDNGAAELTYKNFFTMVVTVEIGGLPMSGISVSYDTDKDRLYVTVPDAELNNKVDVTVVYYSDDSPIYPLNVTFQDKSGKSIFDGVTNEQGVCTKAATVATNSTISGVGDAVVKIDGQQVKDGDKLTLEFGKTYTIQWSPCASGDNVKFLNTVVNNDRTTISALTDIDKSNWTEDNTLYNAAMGQTGNKMVTLSKVEASVQSVQFVAAEINKLQFNWVEVAPVYRMYNSITSEHLFSTNKTEYDNFVKSAEAGQDYWLGEGIDWFTSVGQTDATVYRLYNSALGAQGRSSHYYTSDEAEVSKLTAASAGWVLDDEVNYFKSAGDASIYTAYSEDLGSAHLYTSSYDEWSSLDLGWDKETSKNGVTTETDTATGFFKAWMGTRAA